MREFSLGAVLLGLVMCVVRGAANAYLGLKAGMTLSEAKRLCPQAVILEGHAQIYRCFAEEVFARCRDVAPAVETFLDEAYCDLTGTERLHGDLIEAAKRNPGKYSYAYYGDLASPSVAALGKVELVRVPYKGGVPGMVDVAGGRVDFIYSSLAQAGPMLQSRKLKPLAVSGDQRLADWPDVPTAKEVLPQYRAVDYQVLLAPKGTPKAIVDELYAKTAAALNSEDLRRQFGEKGAQSRPMRPDEVRAFMEADLASIGEVCKAAWIVPE
jgi:hypothetical protein